MSSPAERFAQAAEALAGAPFRLHGRSAATGLDCIGLVGAALARCERRVRYPQGYRLRNAEIARWLGLAERNGLSRCAGPVRRGDILLTQPAAAQHHLLIALGGNRFVHAHAGLRRVVCQQLALPEPPLAQWRLEPDMEQTWPR